MKKLWTVCMLLAFAVTAFASYQKEDVKAAAPAEPITFEKAMAYYEAGLALTPEMKQLLASYLEANARGEGGSLDLQGGPDAFGYMFVDNQAPDTVVYNWIELCNDALATAVVTTGDDVTTSIPFGLNFPYYGTVYTSGWASSNGMLSLSASNNAWTNAPISATNTNSAIYVYWDDMLQTTAAIGQCDVNGKMFYRNFGDYTVIEWKRFDPFSGTGLTSVEVILWTSGMIKIQWNTPDYTHTSVSATVGIEAPLADGLQYIHNTAGIVGGRAVVFYPPLQAPSGRCCYLREGVAACEDLSADDCSTLGGQWGGSGSSCATAPCPTGRCCYVADGADQCATNIQLECMALNGVWTAGLDCSTPCPVGRCCYGDGCATVSSQLCTQLGGTWAAGLNCTANPCPVSLQGSDLCADAPAISPNITVSGTTVGATAEVGIPSCGSGYNATAVGVWYTTIGTGNTMTVGLCDPLTTYDSEMFVFCGSCDALTCIGGDDDGCVTPGLASTLSWCSNAGTRYYILVTAFGAGSGTYALSLSDDGVPCTGAINCSPEGRCCYVASTGAPACATVTAEECLMLGGEFDALLTCETAPCVGACCYVQPGSYVCDAPTAVCVDNVFESTCVTLGGQWSAGLTCNEVVCEVVWTAPCVCECSTQPNAHAIFAVDNTTYPILDVTTNDFVINVPIEYRITDLNVCIDAMHTFDGDVEIRLTSPLGTTIILSDNRGSSGDNWVCTQFDDEAVNAVATGLAPFTGSWIPDNALSAFDGQNAVGNWTLTFEDQAGGDEGWLLGACLKFEYDIILPAEFGGFSAVSRNGEVALAWSTLSERDLSSFEVSRDGSVIAVVEAQNSATGAEYSYVDATVTNGTTYSYSLTVVDANGARQELATVEATPGSQAVVTEYALHQNYPNPFNPTTNIAFDMVEAGHVSISVFNIMGQKVAELVNGTMAAGRHTVSFDAASLSSGLYLYKMEANGFTAQSKMILMK